MTQEILLVEGPSTIETDVISQGPQIYNGELQLQLMSP